MSISRTHERGERGVRTETSAGGAGTEDSRNKSGAPSRSKQPSRLGERGEQLAAEYLTETGLTVLSRNWRCREGELDLVATDGEQVVVCEVKTRSGDDFGTPAESVTPAKMSRLRRLARLWLSAYHVGWCVVRFDVVAVLWPPGGEPEITHFRGVV